MGVQSTARILVTGFPRIIITGCVRFRVMIGYLGVGSGLCFIGILFISLLFVIIIVNIFNQSEHQSHYTLL